MPVLPLPPTPPTAPAVGAAASAAAPAGSGSGFSTALQSALQSLDTLQSNADNAAAQMAGGSATDLTTAVIAAEKANLAMQLAVQVRNRAVSAYQQLMQLQM